MKDHFYWFFIVDDDTYVSHRNAVMALIKRVPKKELLALGYIGCGGANLAKISDVWVRFFGWLCLKVYVKCAAIQCLWNYEPKSSKWLRCLLHQRFQKLRSRGYLWSHMDHTRIIVCFGSRCNKASPGRGCFPWYNRPTLADRDRPPWRKVSIAQTGGWVVVDFVVVLMHWVWARWKRYSTKAMEAVDTRPLDPFIEIPSNFLEDWFNFRKDVSI